MDQDIAIEVRDPDLCPRYAARVIRGVTIAESPLWLKARICHAGMRPISNVVDVTNYVLWARDSPCTPSISHRSGGRIIVRRARPGEPITTLDNELERLPRTCWSSPMPSGLRWSPASWAGSTAKSPRARPISFRGCNFAAPSIMRTSAALGLRSEASTRYEKGLDPEMIPLALDMACSLLVEVCGGPCRSERSTCGPCPPEKCSSCGPRDRAGARCLVPMAEIVALLTRLGCSVTACGEDFPVAVPSFRGDLEREIDLIEEIARIHGLDQIPSTLPAGGWEGAARSKGPPPDRGPAGGCRPSQVITYSFGDDKWPDRLRLAPDDRDAKP